MAAPGWLTIHLVVRVALCPDAIEPPAWVDEQVAAARAVFAAHRIALVAEHETFTPASCELLDAPARDALATDVAPSARVTVLVVRRIRDLDVPSYDLMGVHWRARGRHWVYLTARARPPVLAHELCHHFGLPHDPEGGNLMTPGPSSPAWRSPHPPRPFAPVLTEAQAARLRRGIRAAAR